MLIFWSVLKSQGRSHSKPPTSLVGQLLWREFYVYNGFVTPNYDRMKGNPVCRQIPWDHRPDLLEAWQVRVIQLQLHFPELVGVVRPAVGPAVGAQPCMHSST